MNQVSKGHVKPILMTPLTRSYLYFLRNKALEDYIYYLQEADILAACANKVKRLLKATFLNSPTKFIDFMECSNEHANGDTKLSGVAKNYFPALFCFS